MVGDLSPIGFAIRLLPQTWRKRINENHADNRCECSISWHVSAALYSRSAQDPGIGVPNAKWTIGLPQRQLIEEGCFAGSTK
jgi:hypothetical protein